jgi:hypothetical protein
MLAAPVFNPVVLASTYVAFRGDFAMVVGRLGLVLVPAVVLGGFLGSGRPSDLLRKGFGLDGEGPEHRRGFLEVLQHAGTDFLDMGRFLLLGALVSALFKSFVPAQPLLAVRGNILLSTAVMMALAIVLSICSEADAFVAASLGFVPRLAQLSFVSIGPMVDIKLISMYASVFRRPVAVRLIYVPVLLVYSISVLAGGFLEAG